MKILLTGPTGFIGAAFTRLALSQGHHVAGLALPAEAIPDHLPPHQNLRWLRGTLDSAPWDEIDLFQPDVCIHTAWITTPGVYLESPDNYTFMESSLNFLRRGIQAGVRHVVSLGTCIEYQITDQPLSEAKTPVAPTTTYARCKNELRLKLEAETKPLGFSLCWARVFYPYGPREHPSRLCSSIISQLRKGETIRLKTPASSKDYIFIEDLADAILTTTEKRFTGSLNLGTGIAVSVREIAQTLGEMLGRPELIQEVSPPQVDPLGFVVADASRLRALGWTPAHTMRQGLARLLSHLTQP